MGSCSASSQGCKKGKPHPPLSSPYMFCLGWADAEEDQQEVRRCQHSCCFFSGCLRSVKPATGLSSLHQEGRLSIRHRATGAAVTHHQTPMKVTFPSRQEKSEGCPHPTSLDLFSEPSLGSNACLQLYDVSIPSPQLGRTLANALWLWRLNSNWKPSISAFGAGDSNGTGSL